MYSILKKIVSSSAIIVAIIFSIYRSFVKPLDAYENMILSLLILICTSFLLETFNEKNKWDRVNENLDRAVFDIKNCKITVFDNSDEWVNTLNEMLGKGKHTVDNASIDSATRTKVKSKNRKLWEHVNFMCKNPDIKLRHIIRVRKNNYENLLDRIISGSSKSDSYFSYYTLPQDFPFATFGIVDKTYICTRSPYAEGESPRYLIIENSDLVQYFESWFNQLWTNSHKINSVDNLYELYSQFCDDFTEAEKKRIEKKHKQIERVGVMEDI